MKRRSRKRQLASQRLLARAIDAIANAVFITDAHGKIVWANAAFTRLSGYRRADILGRTPAFLKSGMQDADFYRVLWHTISAGKVWQSEVTDRRRDGLLYVADEIITPLLDADGKISHYVAVQHDVTQRKLRSDQDHHLAYHDPLTGLPNRRYFESALDMAVAQAADSGAGLAVLFIDLDKFKPVNDTLGHQVGDMLLAAVAGRLRAALRDSDTVARLGGDEFGVMLLENASREVAAALATKLVTALSRPYGLVEQPIVIGASVGIALYPDDGIDARDLLTRADAAMYLSKAQGGQQVCFASAVPAGPP